MIVHEKSSTFINFHEQVDGQSFPSKILNRELSLSRDNWILVDNDGKAFVIVDKRECSNCNKKVVHGNPWNSINGHQLR